MPPPDPSSDLPSVSEQAANDAAALVGTTIAGRYTVEKLLGEGGMGAVFLVQHKSLRKRLALKLLRPELMSNPAVLARFEREAMAAAHLEHPNVAAASDFGRAEDERFFLVLEYVEGQELRDAMVKAQGPMPLARALFITRQIVTALIRAHELGIVHRDLKPENIMLVKRDGHSDFVKVLDFGLAQVPRKIATDAVEEAPQKTEPQLTRIGDIFGTPAYMAPEQSVGESTDIRSDLYSLGIILYEMLAGTRPFTGKSLPVLMEQHLTMPPPPFSASAPTVKIPKTVESLVQRLLAKDAKDRFQDPQGVLDAIDPIISAQKLKWPPDTSLAAEASRSPAPAAGQRIPSLHRAWTALRIRPATILARAKAEETITIVRRRLPKSFARAPLWLLLSGGALVVVLPLVLVFRALLDGEPAPGSITSGSLLAKIRPPPEAALASQPALDAAIAQGPDALEVLASRFPTDPRIRRALLRSLASQRRYADAMRVIAKLAQLDPNTGRDDEVIQVIVQALSNPESAPAASALLERDLGEAGVELLFDLTAKQTGARWKSRLSQSLTKSEVLAKASPALRIAIELRAAKRCEAKRELLPRVQQEGDQRALTQLKSLTQPQGCGFLGLQDCWPCLRKSAALQDTITALEARNNSTQGKP